MGAPSSVGVDVGEGEWAGLGWRLAVEVMVMATTTMTIMCIRPTVSASLYSMSCFRLPF